MQNPFLQMNDTIRAALWMGGAIVSFSTMAVAGRAVSLDHDTFELMLYRSLIGIVLVVAFGRAAGTLGEISTKKLGLHLVRNLSHFTGQNLWFYALTLIPLAQLFALEFTSPIWVMFLAAMFLGERITRVRFATAGLGFVGVYIVARPQIGHIDMGIILAALAAIGFAGSAIATKILSKDQSITCILFWLTFMQAVFGLVTAGADLSIRLPSVSSSPWIAVVAVCGLGAHFCLTKALTIAPASVVMPVDFLRLPIIAIIGVVLYSEPLDVWVIAGGALIFLANFINIRSETRAKP